MRILGFDTATSACSAALWDAGEIKARGFEAMARGHSEHLIGMIQGVLADAGRDFAALDLIAVTTGPGAFTGLRIGLAAARGLALAAGLPCLGVTTLETIAAAVPEAERRARTLLVVLETKRQDVYAQAFDAGLDPLGAPRALAPSGLHGLVAKGGVVVAGDAAERALAALLADGVDAVRAPGSGVPDAAQVCAIAAVRWNGDKDLPPPGPLYLSPPLAKLPKAGGRLRP